MMLSTNSPRTPTSSLRKGLYPRSPLRIQTPRMSPSPVSFSSSRSTPRRRRHHHGSNISSGDRFIPNRARMDPARRTSSCLDRVQEEEKAPDSEYKRQLRRALFGQEEESSSVFGFGQQQQIQQQAQSQSSSINHPFGQDILRDFRDSQTIVSMTPSSLQKKKPIVPRRRTVKAEFQLEAPDVLEDDALNLVSVGQYIAIGLENSVYLSNGGDTTESIDLDVVYVSSVKWNHSNRNHLAIGANDEVQVWDIDAMEGIHQLKNHCGIVTALEWKDENELLASSRSGIHLYDLRLAHNPTVDTYPGFGPDHSTTRLQWHPYSDHVFAAAGGNAVRLWDVRNPLEPLLAMQHESVRGMEFCPMDSDLLATGGANGIHLWNLRNATLQTTIATHDPVTSLLWSPFLDTKSSELMASYGDHMAVWSMTAGHRKVHRLAAFGTDSHVLTLERLNGTGRVLSLHAGDESLVGWNAFGGDEPPTSSKESYDLGPLEMMPVIR
jgi:WD40 repeat protein